jgi:hypothetical protein
MYCVQCGVRLAEGELVCPLCHTEAVHPTLGKNEGKRQYPADRHPTPVVSPWGTLFILTALFLLPIIITPLCDLRVHGELTWSYYAIFGTVLGYIVFVLPQWFKKHNPVIFTPCNFAAIAAYVLFVDLYSGAPHWFMPFAFPLIVSVAIIVCTYVTLSHYVKRGRLYVYGGVTLAVALFILMCEFLVVWNFDVPYYGWGIYPCVVLSLLGISFFLIAIIRPLRESLEKKIFLEPPSNHS